MNIEDFKNSITESSLPAGLTIHLQALWYDGNNDWKRAHDLIDQLHDADSAHVHAYLHRKEGDIWNADYWYRRAGKTRPNVTLEQEWEGLIRIYLK